jgi:hypothetical protein
VVNNSGEILRFGNNSAEMLRFGNNSAEMLRFASALGGSLRVTGRQDVAAATATSSLDRARLV